LLPPELGGKTKGSCMRFDLPEDKKLIYETTIPIRWGDMDAMQHVNNAAYFRYMEVVRIDWMHSVGATPNPGGEGPVIVNAFCSFIKQLEFPGTVVAKQYVANPGRSSFETYVTLARAEAPEVICATGGAKIVWVDSKAQKSAPLPDWLRNLLV
jgi:acyl-CoA thioester hydrolase